MRLVFITRKVDRGDALAGFAFSWLAGFARKLEKLYVICQEKGDTAGLPDNVEVHSFGKEQGYGKLRQGLELFTLIWKLVKNSDGVMAHMHPIYAIMTWPIVKLYRKKLILWYTHKSVDFKLRLAHALVDVVLTASKESFRLPSNKVKVVGHGIDLDKFKVKSEKLKVKAKFKIVSIGRISPVKDYETLIRAAEMLRDQGMKDFEVHIYGRVGLPEHQSYLDSLIEFVRNAELENYIKFQGELNYDFVDEAYAEADLFVNLSATGSIDKAVLEAAASGVLVLTSNEAFFAPLRKISDLLIFKRDHPEDLAQNLIKLKNLNTEERQAITGKLYHWVATEHNLDNLVKRIIGEFQS